MDVEIPTCSRDFKYKDVNNDGIINYMDERPSGMLLENSLI
jgi:hypothetical protein